MVYIVYNVIQVLHIMNNTPVKNGLYPLILNRNNLVSDSNNNTYRYSFPAGAAQFQNSKIAIANINIFFSWFNITAANNNNTFQITFPTLAGSTTYTITIPDGYYSIPQLNSYIQQFCIINGLYLVNTASQNVYYFEFVENPSAYAVQFNSYPVPTALPAGWTNPAGMTFPVVASTPLLIVQANNFRNFIGFNAGTFPAVFQATNYSKTSDFTPQVNLVSSIILTCSLLNNRYVLPGTILYSFTPSSFSFGDMINEKPPELSFIDIQDGQYSDFTISLLNQNLEPITIRDTNVVIQLIIDAPSGRF